MTGWEQAKLQIEYLIRQDMDSKNIELRNCKDPERARYLDRVIETDIWALNWLKGVEAREQRLNSHAVTSNER